METEEHEAESPITKMTIEPPSVEDIGKPTDAITSVEGKTRKRKHSTQESSDASEKESNEPLRKAQCLVTKTNEPQVFSQQAKEPATHEQVPRVNVEIEQFTQVLKFWNMLKKLELAKRRAEEEAELARQNAKTELRRLEDEATLAELDWKIERDYDEGTGLLGANNEVPPNYGTDKLPFQHSRKPALEESEPSRLDISKRPCKTMPDVAPVDYSTPFDKVPCAKTRKTGPVTNSRLSCHEDLNSFECKPKAVSVTKQEENTPKDHVAAMWKVQLLNGIVPTQFSGNPAEFPFFREQTRTHLESELLNDAQRVDYLPKFLKGEALKVIQRNRGCSYDDLMRTLKERFGQPIQVSQAYIEDLVSGPRLTYGDSVSLQNFAEELNTASKILRGDVEREASAATNLRRIVNRLPNDLITKWQTQNYEIVSRGRTARLQDIADFVKRQASIRNDPVFGSQRQRRENKEENRNAPRSKGALLLPAKNTTISSTQAENQFRKKPLATCSICKSGSHRLQHCPIISQCDRVAVRRQYAASYGFCFNCGCPKPNHSGSACPEPPACTKCTGHHLTLLHKENDSGRRFRTRDQKGDVVNNNANQQVPPAATPPLQPQGSRQEIEPPAGNKHQSSVSSGCISTERAQVLLNVLPVTVTTENGASLSTYGFLDNGCTDTLIDSELADQLNLEGPLEQISIKTIRNKEELIGSKCVSFTLSPVEGCSRDIDVNEAYVLPDLNQSEQILPEKVDFKDYPHLQDLTFPEVDMKRVSIIVGNNVPAAHLQNEVRFPPDENGPHGYRSPLGWSIAGPLNSSRRKQASVNFLSVGTQHEDPIERFWKIEDYGATRTGDKPLSIEDKQALKILEDTTTFVNGHYEVGLLWREDEPWLPNNYTLAKRRLELLWRRLTKPENRELAAKYREVMDEYISKGYARKLSREQAAMETSYTWYLPHHPVINLNKPGKLRIVFDTAAEFQGTSLNKKLIQGLDMTNSLIGVLLPFRQGKVGLAADVEAMFHQVRVRKQDQDALRSLWWTDDYGQPPDVYVMEVHIFGATSSPCVANSVLRRRAADNAKRCEKGVTAIVEKNFYVDDALPSFKDENLAARAASSLAEMLVSGGFRLTKFMSNSKDTLSKIPAERRAKPELNLDLDELPVERALGVRWFLETD
ncbi:LOW QUALITY PROTEIN: uncharacterized protein LOC111325175 [Stylophora pistillata]|uniref:LOW QUALITY PROTEIN: uncharacterized protein LOC111325175 n=1 Tax=Stylophora pistillata TaxID=50429 RepID=UPI000C043188|nr:LOW QUALITY PROTEIN: uncharacterized protein LOC111325175 [Stylophora pistillata]